MFFQFECIKYKSVCYANQKAKKSPHMELWGAQLPDQLFEMELS